MGVPAHHFHALGEYVHPAKAGHGAKIVDDADSYEPKLVAGAGNGGALRGGEPRAGGGCACDETAGTPGLADLGADCGDEPGEPLGNHAEIAIGILFGTSVAMLSLVIGATALAGPVTPAPKNWRRIWPFALLAAVMVFLVGLHGPVVHFTGALTLAVEGLIVVALWNAPAGKEAVAAAGAAGEAKDGWPWLAGAAATLLAGAAAIWTMHGKLEFMEFSSRIPPATTAATLLSAALVLPAMRRGRELSRTKQSWLAVTSGVGVVLLNLCALLPLVAMWPYAAAKWPQVTRHGQTMWPKVLWHWHANPAQLLAFPYTVWRVDAVALILLSLLILPTAAEKWDLDGEEGFVLVAGYCAYLVVVMGVTLF